MTPKAYRGIRVYGRPPQGYVVLRCVNCGRTYTCDDESHYNSITRTHVNERGTPTMCSRMMEREMVRCQSISWEVML